MTETADTRVAWRGVRLTARMRDALRYAERLLQRKYPGVTIVPTQGSWSDGSLSAGTHTGAGAADLRTRHLTADQRRALVRALKDAGLVAWFRTPAQGFPEHVHVLDKVTRGMAPGAVWQVRQYAAGRSGLSSNLPDRTYRANVKWDYRKGKPVPA